MLTLTDAQLAEFQESLRWRTGETLPDGRALGVPGKRGRLAPRDDFRVRGLVARFAPADKTVLELGSCEGILTAQLARICRHVVAVEVQPSNIVCALVRHFVHDLRNVTLLLGDARHLDEAAIGPVDIVFHSGLLYHLPDPVEHLFQVGWVGDRLLLCTHYEPADGSPRVDETIERDGRRYRAAAHREAAHDRAGAGFKGVEPMSRWLYRDDLFRLLADVGYDRLEILKERVERNGPRVSLLAWKSRCEAA